MVIEDGGTNRSAAPANGTREHPSNGRRYPDELKDLAFQNWAFIFSRNAAETARELLREWRDVEWGAMPDERTFTRTVQKWSEADQWAAKVRDAIAAIAPDIDVQIITNNIQNAYQASVMMGKIFRGELSPVEVRNYAYAAQIAFNAAGYEASSMPERVKQVTEQREKAFDAADLSRLSPNELAERADRIRRGLPPLPILAEMKVAADERPGIVAPGEPIDAEIVPIRAPTADHRVVRASGRVNRSRLAGVPRRLVRSR